MSERLPSLGCAHAEYDGAAKLPLKSIHGLKRRRPGCSSRLLRSDRSDGPVRQRAAASAVSGPRLQLRAGPSSARPCSVPPGPARPSAAAAAPGCPVLRARFTCTLSSRTFGKIRASFHSCFYVQPTSGRKDPASSTLFSTRFGSWGLAVGPRKDFRGCWRRWKRGRVVQRRVGGG